jgi:hypothetical protein
MNVPAQHVDTLVRLGYTPEEARFVYTVAIHSGYFTHRQFLRFADIKRGKHSQKFLDKLLLQKHAAPHAYHSGERVYHVFSRKVFHSIGHDNLRTRRKHQLDYIKTRLMALDFVLSNPAHHYLETEADKVPFFEERLGVSRLVLPSRAYTSKVSSQTTTRYFVDRFPVHVKDASPSSPVVTFTYLDPGFATLQGFTSHLRAYAGLFHSLRKFELIYVAVSDHAFQSARLEFSRIVLGGTSCPTKDGLLRYFSLRKAWDAGGRVEAADVVFLNAAKNQFRREGVEALYQKWCEGITEETDFAPFLRPESKLHGTISTLLGGESLSVFHRAVEETKITKDGGPDSPACSPQDSPL